MTSKIKQDLARYDKVRFGKIWQDMTRLKLGKISSCLRQDKSYKVRLGKIWQDMTR